MAEQKREPAQPTQRKSPAPKRSLLDKLLRRAEKPAKKPTDPSDGRNFIDIAG